MRRFWVGLLALSMVANVAANPPEIPGEALTARDLGPGIVEGMDAVLAREQARQLEAARLAGPPNPLLGEWGIPSPGAAERPSSGRKYVTNRHGATRMGIGFNGVVALEGAFIAGQGGRGAWAPALRAIGYRDGEPVSMTNWFQQIGHEPAWFYMGLAEIDRVEIEAMPAIGGAAWYALDDLTFFRADDEVPQTVDFEDAQFKQTLTNSDYAGLKWELGSVGFEAPPQIVGAPRGGTLAPATPTRLGTLQSQRGGGGTAPLLGDNFQGVSRGDAGSFSAPPDTCGAIGPNHFVITVNRNFAVYDRASGAELMNVLLGSFLPGSNGDPRVLYDQHSGRWVIVVSDFSTRIYLAVSSSSDAMGSFFKTSFVASSGTDSGCFPDYETLGVDQHGIYTASYMVNCGMSIFALDKAPLIAPIQSLGAVTAFRGLGFEGAIQPAHTYGAPVGEYLISTDTSASLRVRRVNPPLNAPTLSDLGPVPVAGFSEPADMPAQGSATPLDSVGSRLMNAVYRDGAIYAAHAVAGPGGRSACRWYQIGVSPLSVQQSGEVSDPVYYLAFPGIAVNGDGDIALGLAGSHSGVFGSCFYTGRRASDPAGQMGPPTLLKAGQAAHNILDQFGRNRWGDYSLTTVDPLDDSTFWTVQEYAEATDIWSTWVAELIPDDPALTISLPDGAPELLAPGLAVNFDVLVTPGTESIVPGSPSLFYRYDGGVYLSSALSPLGGDLYRATLPAPDCGDSAELYVSALGNLGTLVTDPDDAPATAYAAQVGQSATVFSDNFQIDLGWTVTNVALTDGPWDRGVPAGAGDRGDPTSDFDGSGACYLTDNVAGNSDVDGGPTRLTSPAMDLSAPGAYSVSYARWFSNDDNDIDRLTIEVSNNNGSSWTLVESVGNTGGWQPASFVVNDFVAPTSQVRVRFNATDNPNDSVTEAAIDAFAVTSFTCTDPPACPGDFNDDGVIDITDLSIQLSNFGIASGAGPEDGDMDLDGDVDIVDLSNVLAVFGTACG